MNISPCFWDPIGFQVFDTHAAESEALVAFVGGLSSGSLVLFGARDDAQSNMTVAAKDARHD